MGLKDNAKALIDANVYANGQERITGQGLNATLKGMVDILPTTEEIVSGIKGVATISTVPSATEFERWLVHEAGTYTNFGGITVTAADLGVVNGVANNRVIFEVQDGVSTKIVERVKGDTGELTAQQILDLENAVSTSEEAIGIAEDVRSEFDQVIAGSDSNPEVVNARGGEVTLNARLNKSDDKLEKTYDAVKIKSVNLVSKKEGQHIAFGSICRVADTTPNINLVVWRAGANHQDGGFIEGILVSNFGEKLSERFVINDQTRYPNAGRGGMTSVNDYRDPNIIRLPNGDILMTGMYANWVGSTRDRVGGYAQLGHWNTVSKILTWDDPVTLFPIDGYYPYGKPIIDGDWLYMMLYTHPGFTDATGSVHFMIAKAPLSNPTAWEVIDNIIHTDTAGLSSSEPILRKTGSGKYVIYFRYQSATYEIRRIESNSIDSGWGSPETVFTGSSHTKGLIITPEGWIFAGIRYVNSQPSGVAILTADSAEWAAPFKLSSMLYSAFIESDEAGYCEFESIGSGKYIGMYHTETGSNIRFFTFSTADIRNKEIKTEQPALSIEAESNTLGRTSFIGVNGLRNQNLLQNPFLDSPYGMNTPLYWHGISGVKSIITDDVGEGYVKYTANNTILRQYLPKILQRTFTKHPPVAAARIYCKTAGRLSLRVFFGNNLSGIVTHSGNGWETLVLYVETASRFLLPSTGTKDNVMAFEIATSSGATSVTYFVDWASLGFGSTVPEPMNGSALSIANIIRVNLPQQVTSFTFADLGISNKISSAYYIRVVEPSGVFTGATFTKSTTGFTVNLAAGTSWGGGFHLVLEIIG